jgi:hypothetical protein
MNKMQGFSVFIGEKGKTPKYQILHIFIFL